MHTQRPTSTTARRTTTLAAVCLLALAATACSARPAPSGTPTRLGSSADTPSTVVTTPTGSTSTPAPGTQSGTEAGSPSQTPSAAPTSPATPTTTPKPTVKPEPAPVVVLEAGDSGSKVRILQARLRQINWYEGDVTDYYGSRTTTAVKGFQAKRGYAATGTLDEKTWERLLAMTRKPTKDELANVKPKPPAVPPKGAPGALTWDVDQRCLTGRVMCISKGDNSLTWVIDGVPQYRFDVRFGSDELPTREGTFSVLWKKKDVISNLYHTPMPYSMFFSGGQAVHYSSNFARLGYNGASHGCVNVRDWDGVVRLYNESRVGDKVIVHW